MVHAFADDSVLPAVVACGVAAFRAERAAEAEAVLAATKRSFSVSPDEPLHCRVIFSGDARRGTFWEKLRPERIYKLVEAVCREVGKIGERPIVVLVNPAVVPPQPVTPGPTQFLDPKVMASMTYWGA